MKILIGHNYYKQPGGEDQCVAAEIALLKAFGHEVIRYQVHNDAIDTMGRFEAASSTIWNRSSYRELRSLIRKDRPQVAHFHNTFPLISAAAYDAARAEGVPTVQTLHNFRLLCPNALFFRDGHICEDCLGRSLPWPGVVHKCYRNNRAASTAVVTMLTVHRVRGTWRNKVDRYIALTQFSRNKLIQGGLPGEKIVVKPNFVYPDPGRGDGAGGYAIYVGRLSAEKGIDVLLHAWRDSAIPLKIVGDGPLAGKVRKASGKCIEWLGSKSLDEVYALIGAATFLVLPSECYENFPRVVIEAFAKGTPVIASRLGAMAEIVDHGRTGFHFTAGDGASLAATIRQALSMPVEDRARMRQAARQDYEGKYSAEENHRSLMAIYEQALAAPTKNGCIPVGGRA